MAVYATQAVLGSLGRRLRSGDRKPFLPSPAASGGPPETRPGPEDGQ